MERASVLMCKELLIVGLSMRPSRFSASVNFFGSAKVCLKSFGNPSLSPTRFKKRPLTFQVSF